MYAKLPYKIGVKGYTLGDCITLQVPQYVALEDGVQGINDMPPQLLIECPLDVNKAPLLDWSQGMYPGWCHLTPNS